MRIDLNPGAQEVPETSGRTSSASQPSAVSNSSAVSESGEDQAQLTGVHVQVPALAAQALQLPEIRQERVTALRQVVQSGSYSPDTEQVARALFAHMLVKPAA